MNRRYKTILIRFNRAIITANVFMIGLAALQPMDLKKAQRSKAPFLLNLLVFLVLKFAFFVMTYSACRQANVCCM